MTGALVCADVRSAKGQAQKSYTFGVNGTVLVFSIKMEMLVPGQIFMLYYFIKNVDGFSKQYFHYHFVKLLGELNDYTEVKTIIHEHP